MSRNLIISTLIAISILTVVIIIQAATIEKLRQYNLNLIEELNNTLAIELVQDEILHFHMKDIDTLTKRIDKIEAIQERTWQDRINIDKN